MYTATRRKHTVADTGQYVTEMDVFYMLDGLKPTAAGLDALPAWFLKVSAPVLAARVIFFDALTGTHHQYSCDSDHVM